MGVRSRNRKKNHRRHKQRARRRRREMMSAVRPECPECGRNMAREESIAEIWRCRSCRRSFLRVGAELAPEIHEIITVRFDRPILRLPTDGTTRRAA
jgi:ribosomal protein L37AE/L43A